MYQPWVEAGFWFSVGMIVYVFLGYPAFLWVVTLFKTKRNVPELAELPSVSVVIAAYNEGECIQETIENKLALDYPADRLEVLVTSDGSTDGTDEIVRSFESQGVRFFRQAPRQGKTAALNKMVAEARGEIIVFSDANSIYQEDAIRKIVRSFSHPDVGYATGRMVYVDETKSSIGSGCSVYMRYENVLRELESQVGSVIGVDGGIDATRKILYEPMSVDLLPDLVLPFRVIAQGKRVVFEREAVLRETTLTQNVDEWAMRVRVALRSFHAISAMRSLLNPWRYPRAAFQICSHKVFRYLAGLFQLSALGCNVLLAPGSLFYSTLLAAQGIFYSVALLGWSKTGARRMPGAIYAFYLCFLNAASLVALVKFLGGERQAIWKPRRG